ncbi:Eukaryotic translation initiation factor 4B [Coemansia sp. RSA 2052]|nr:Eukaryotic translation initiation factor 4B [Coemansia sp. RSA 2052]
MSLGDFLSEGPSNMSWADDDLVLPSAPMATAVARTSVTDAPDRKDLISSRYDSMSREPRGPVEFPTEPPYTANVGNMPFTADEPMLRDFFSGVQSVRLIRDRDTDKLKGFGYVQFDTLEALKEAVAKDGQELGGRQLRVSVADRRPNAPGGAYEDRTGGASNWRRADALPEPVAATSQFESRSSSGFGRTPSSGRGEPREPREPREPLPPSAAEKVSDWRMHKEPAAVVPVAEAQSPPHHQQVPPPRRSGFGDRFSRSSSGAGPDSADEPRAWRRERRDSDTATSPPPSQAAQTAAPHAPRREPREPREYQPPRDRSASREPIRAPRQPTVAEQANTWRSARAAPPPVVAEKPVVASEPEAPVPVSEPVAEPVAAEPVVPESKPANVEAVGEVEEEGWSHVEKPTAPRRAPHQPPHTATGRGGSGVDRERNSGGRGGGFDRDRSGSGRHRDLAATTTETNGDAEKRSPRSSERRGFFAGRDTAASATESSGSWRR